MQAVFPFLQKEANISEEFSADKQVTLHCGDSMDFPRTMPDEAVSLVITSPPYNIGKEYETKTEIENYLQFQEQIISELIRILRPDGSICWEVGNYVENSEVFPLDVFYYMLFKNKGLKLRNRIIWSFGHGLHCSKRFSGRYETILWFTKGDKYTFNLDSVRIPSKYPGKLHYKGRNKGKPSGNPLGKNPSDVWEIIANDWDKEIWEIPNVKSNHPEKTIHPSQFPIELVERLVLALTNEGDVVFDPFVGVGSAIIGAILHDRKGVGVDKEKKYMDIACQRIIAALKGKLTKRPLGKPVYKPKGTERVAKPPPEWQMKLLSKFK